MLLYPSEVWTDRVSRMEGAAMKVSIERLRQKHGAVGYIFLWILGVPASILFVIFLMRGCT